MTGGVGSGEDGGRAAPTRHWAAARGHAVAGSTKGGEVGEGRRGRQRRVAWRQCRRWEGALRWSVRGGVDRAMGSAGLPRAQAGRRHATGGRRHVAGSSRCGAVARTVWRDPDVSGGGGENFRVSTARFLEGCTYL